MPPRALLYALLLAGIVLLAGCTGVERAEAGQAGEQVLVVGGAEDFLEGEEIKANVFEMLVRVNERGEVEPFLAESWSVSGDGTEYTFRLRRNVTFHDGTPWDAEAAKWFWLWKKNTGTGGFVKYIRDAEVVDRYTVVYRLTEPYPSLLKDLASQFKAEVISPTSVEPPWSYTGKRKRLIGTGPFRVEEYRKEQLAVLVRYDAYWGDRPRLERIVYRYIPDENTRVMALKRGEVDIIGATEHHASIPFERIPELEADPGIVVDQHSYGRIQVVEFNCGRGVFTDRRVRQAVNHAIDRQALVEKLFRGYGVPATTITSPDFPFASSLRGRGYEYDPERARKLLEEVGWVDTDGDGVREKDGEELVVRYLVPIGEANANTVAVYLQSELKKIGMKVEVVTLERGAAYEAKKRGEYDLFLHHSGNIPWAPEGLLLSKYHSSSTAWPYACHSDELDRLIERAIASGDNEDFNRVYLKLQEENVCIPLYDIVKTVAYNKKVRGYVHAPTMYEANFRTVYIEE
ncbi:MAG: hypothetical protein GXN98_04515 [Euryarchaeota archaeon]|nr:hypothetical protein [Euryarchaeota archaeon]